MMKFGHVIEYNIRNNFLEKLYTKFGGETIHRPFLKLQNWAVCFHCLPSQGLSKDFETKLQTTCFYLI